MVEDEDFSRDGRGEAGIVEDDNIGDFAEDEEGEWSREGGEWVWHLLPFCWSRLGILRDDVGSGSLHAD